MKTELLIQKTSTGVTMECSSITQSVTITTNRTGAAGKMTFSLLKPTSIEDAGDNAVFLDFTEGNPVRFSVDGKIVFFGYVFTKSKNRWGEIEVTCYDQLRYLKTNESYIFSGMTAGQIITKIAGDFNLRIGTIEDTGYAIPSLVKENISCLDIISYAVELTTYNTGKVFVFYDDAGYLALREASSLMNETVIGTKSFLGEYTYKTDIDSETYNQVKLVRPNKTTGKADTFIVQNSETIKEWGLLQLYEKVDENLNDAQVTEQAKTMLTYYNRKLRTLSIDALGVVGIRAGAMVFINVPDLGDISLSKFVLLDKVTHVFENEKHTMSIETRTIS